MQPEHPNLLEAKFTTKFIPLFGSVGEYSYETQEDYFNPILGYPALPIIGRYGGAGYELNQTVMAMSYPCTMHEGRVRCMGQELHLPKKAVEVLTTIPELIIHNKPPKKKPNNESKKGGKKGGKGGVLVEVNEDQQPDNILDYHPLTFKVMPNFRFRIIISLDQSKKPNEFLNYVNHTYIFRHIDFSQTKRVVQYVCACLIEPQTVGTSNVYPWTRDYKSMSFDQIRSEYISFHLKKGAPAFSPNNFKIGVRDKSQYVSFYTVVLGEIEHVVNYHWHVIGKVMAREVEETLAKSKCLWDFLREIKERIGKCSAVEEIERIFAEK